MRNPFYKSFREYAGDLTNASMEECLSLQSSYRSDRDYRTEHIVTCFGNDYCSYFTLEETRYREYIKSQQEKLIRFYKIKHYEIYNDELNIFSKQELQLNNLNKFNAYIIFQFKTDACWLTKIGFWKTHELKTKEKLYINMTNVDIKYGIEASPENPTCFSKEKLNDNYKEIIDNDHIRLLKDMNGEYFTIDYIPMTIFEENYYDKNYKRFISIDEAFKNILS